MQIETASDSTASSIFPNGVRFFPWLTPERGFAEIVQQASMLCSELNSDVRPEWIVKRLQFFGYDLQALRLSDKPLVDRVKILNKYFFDLQRFQALSDNNSVPERVTLHSVLAKRVGTPHTIAMIYAYLANKCGIKLEFVKVHPSGVLKFCENGLSRYLDMAKGGRWLEPQELLDSLQHKDKPFSPMHLDPFLETMNFADIFVEYLQSLKMAYRLRESVEPQLTLQTWLLRMQPSNLQALGERALLLRRLGHCKRALADLKRYFSFVDKDAAPNDLQTALDELSRLQEKRERPSPQHPRPNR